MSPRSCGQDRAHAFAALVLLFVVAVPSCSRSETPRTGPSLPVDFPSGFRMGFATVAFQAEGTLHSDGTPVASNWSEWIDMGGKIADGSRNDHGNGFHDGWQQDLDLSAQLGANSVSYAIDWARLEPQPGQFDDAELQKIVDKLTGMRARNLHPLLVLFHWVTPTWVQSPTSGTDLLAKEPPSFADAFEPLVRHIVPVLAPIVDDWVTFEEPYSIVLGEYLSGEHPPGHILDMASSMRALVNLMYMHARAYHAVKQLDTLDADGDGVAANVGFENLAVWVTPLDPTSPDDQRTADRFHYILNRQFINAVWNGDVDLDMDGSVDNPSIDPPERHDDSLARTLDFVGLNYYQRIRAWSKGALAGVAPFFGTPQYDVRTYDGSLPHSDLYQEISSEGLRRMIEEYARWGLPMVITETGIADSDDDQRPYYLLDHMYTVANAIRDGYDLRGFYCWTIADNFEWTQGFAPKFGVTSFDASKPGYPRTPRPSSQTFSDIAHARRIDPQTWNRWARPAYPVGIP